VRQRKFSNINVLPESTSLASEVLLRIAEPTAPCVGEPFSSAAAGRSAVRTFLQDSTMSNVIKQQIEQEPIGIVISRGSRQEDVPRVFAYVWGPAPEPSEEVRESKVA